MKTQYLTAVTVNLLTLIHGISSGWVSPNLVRFQSDKSPIGRITPAQGGLVVSMLFVGSVLGTFIYGYLAERFGRKWPLLGLSVPQIAANVLLIIGTHPYHVYVSRFLIGLACGGIFSVIPVFVSEIALNNIRGALGSILALSRNVGLTLGFVLASWTDYYIVPYVSITLNVIFLLIFVWLPESPDFLFHTNQIEKADRAFAFYGKTRPKVSTVRKNESISWRDFKEPSIRRACGIAFMVIFFKDTCGTFVIASYSTVLLMKANIQVDVYVVTVALGFLKIIGSAVSAFGMDRLGRRVLFMTSSMFCFVALCAFGLYFNLLRYTENSTVKDGLVQKLQWLPVASLALVILGSSLACAAAPLFLISELLPTKFRARVAAIAVIQSSITGFVVVQNYHNLMTWIGVDGTHWAFAAVCFMEAIYVYFFLPETKSLTIEQIQLKLASPGIRKHSTDVVEDVVLVNEHVERERLVDNSNSRVIIIKG